MIAYLVRRLLQSAFVILIVVSASFVLIRLMPGNPMQVLYHQLAKQGGMTPLEIQQRISTIYGIQPQGSLFSQYLHYMGNALRGDLGNSILNPSTSVMSVIANSVPWTLLVVGISLIISFVIGIVAGTVMAAFAKQASGKIVTMVSTILSAVPNYLVALLLIYLLTSIKPIFPSTGPYSPDVRPGFTADFLATVAYHAVLPVAASTITAFGAWALAMKGSVVSTLGSDYIRASRTWGLRTRRITASYVGRNSMLPLVTSLALSLGGMFGGSVFIETLFSYPGLGYYLVQSVNSRDYSLMMGCFILITVAVILANLLVDLLYPLVDPRIARAGSSRAARAARRLAARTQAEAALEKGAPT